MIPALVKIQNLLRQAGGYRCPHFEVHKVNPTKKPGCCGTDRGEQYVPVCGLINGVCTGLAQCPRLDVKTKSELIKQWTMDLKTNKNINPLEYVKK